MRAKLVLCLAVVFVFGALGGAFAAAASADVIVIDSEFEDWFGNIWKDHIEIPLLAAKVKQNTIATAGNTITGVSIGGEACNSAGAASGEVKTEPTTLEVGNLNEKKKELGIEERPTTGSTYAKFSCGKNEVVLRGALIGKVSPVDKKTKAGGDLTDEVLISSAKEVYTHFEGGTTPAVMELQINGGAFSEVPVSDKSTIAPTGTATLEVKAGKKPVFEITDKIKK